MEVARDLLQKCPELALTVSDDAVPDYILLLHRSQGNFFSGASSQFMLLRRDKSIIYANEKSSSMRASRDACKAIISDWKLHNDAAIPTSSQHKDDQSPLKQPNNLPEPVTGDLVEVCTERGSAAADKFRSAKMNAVLAQRNPPTKRCGRFTAPTEAQ
jgi:hypothetical protein